MSISDIKPDTSNHQRHLNGAFLISRLNIPGQLFNLLLSRLQREADEIRLNHYWQRFGRRLAGCYATRAGLKVLMIDAHMPPHQQGSHHGDTRLIRHAYGEGEKYVPLVLRAQTLWDELSTHNEEPILFAPVLSTSVRQSPPS